MKETPIVQQKNEKARASTEVKIIKTETVLESAATEVPSLAPAPTLKTTVSKVV